MAQGRILLLAVVAVVPYPRFPFEHDVEPPLLRAGGMGEQEWKQQPRKAQALPLRYRQPLHQCSSSSLLRMNQR